MPAKPETEVRKTVLFGRSLKQMEKYLGFIVEINKGKVMKTEGLVQTVQGIESVKGNGKAKQS